MCSIYRLDRLTLRPMLIARLARVARTPPQTEEPKSRMSTKLISPTIVALALALAGCGASSTKTSSTRSASAHAGRPIRIYRAGLSAGVNGPGGRGTAIIAFHGSSVLCWRFAHLAGFTGAIVAQIHSGVRRRSGPTVVSLSRGGATHHRGCVGINPSLSRRIWSRPSEFYVSIYSRSHPANAVHARL